MPGVIYRIGLGQPVRDHGPPVTELVIAQHYVQAVRVMKVFPVLDIAFAILVVGNENTDLLSTSQLNKLYLQHKVPQ